MLDAIRKTHIEFEIEPSIVNLLGTDEILKPDFDPEAFITRENPENRRMANVFKKMVSLLIKNPL